MGPVGVVVVDVVADEALELTLVPDDGSAEKFSAGRSDPALGLRRQASVGAADRPLGLAYSPRYRDGWTHYTNNVNPAAHADIIIDNNNLKHPAIVKQST